MKYDDVLGLLGDFGLYQKVVYVLLCLPIVFTGIHILSPVFTLATPKHRCAIPGMPNDTFKVQSEAHQWLIDTWIPRDEEYSKCNLYKQETHNNSDGVDNKDIQQLANMSSQGYSTLNHSDNIEECTRWVFDKSVFENTVITDTHLVCSRIIYRAHATTAMNVGAIFSYLALGPISDRFGRKVVTFTALIVMVFSSTMLVWLPNIYVFIVIRLFIGFGFVFFNLIFIYVMEFIGPSKRTTCGIMVNHFWAFGLLLQAFLAYFLRSWRHLQLATALPILLFFIYWWKLPNSGRWLIANGHTQEGIAVLKHMAKVNKVNINIEELDIHVEDLETETPANKGFGMLTVFKNKTLAIRSLIVFFNWLVINLMYIGLSLNVGNLGGSIYVNSVSSAMMEVLAYTFCIPAISKLGRKRFHCSCMVTGGVVLLLTIIPKLSNSPGWIVTALSMVGKLVSSAAFSTIYLYSAELFPTVVRATAMGICSICATTGGLIAPYIVELANMLHGRTAQIVPLVIFGVTSLIAGIISLVLPETGKAKLPDTIEDIELMTRKRDASVNRTVGNDDNRHDRHDSTRC